MGGLGAVPILHEPPRSRPWTRHIRRPPPRVCSFRVDARVGAGSTGPRNLPSVELKWPERGGAVHGEMLDWYSRPDRAAPAAAWGASSDIQRAGALAPHGSRRRVGHLQLWIVGAWCADALGARAEFTSGHPLHRRLGGAAARFGGDYFGTV